MTFLLIGAILISFSSVMVKLAGVPADIAGFYRVFGGGLGMAILLWHKGTLNRLTGQLWKWAVFSAALFSADLYFWHRSIDRVGPGLATMLGNFQVIVLALVSIVFLREKVTRNYLVAIPTALVGLYLMVGVSWDTFTPEFQLGIIFGLLTALAYGLYILSLKATLSRIAADPLAMACAVALASSVYLGLSAAAGGDSFIVDNPQSIAALAALALICHAGGWYAITTGLQTVRTSLIGLILLLQPTLSYIWDILFFDKPVTAVELSGVGLALVAIYLGSLKPKTASN